MWTIFLILLFIFLSLFFLCSLFLMFAEGYFPESGITWIFFLLGGISFVYFISGFTPSSSHSSFDHTSTIYVRELHCKEWGNIGLNCKMGGITYGEQFRYVVNGQTRNASMTKVGLEIGSRIFKSCSIVDNDNWECANTVTKIGFSNGEYFHKEFIIIDQAPVIFSDARGYKSSTRENWLVNLGVNIIGKDYPYEYLRKWIFF